MSEPRALRIGVVGLGQCGGNLAAGFAAQGYPALAVNTSQIDLRTLSALQEHARIYIGIDGINGTGGSRPIGEQCLRERAAEVEAAADDLGPVDALLVAAGLGGGTGANLAALVELLATDARPVLALGVLPATAEPYGAKRAALQALNGLIDAPFEALMLADNQRLLDAFGSASVDQYLTEGNAAVIQSVDGLNALAADPSVQALRTYDPAQLRQTLLSGGVTLAGRRDLEPPLQPEALLEATAAIARDHPVLGCGYGLEDAVVVSAVLVVDADTLADTPASVVGEYTARLKDACGGATVHLGLYGAQGSAPTLHGMFGGLPLPGRPQALLQEAGREAERFAAQAPPRGKLRKLDLSGLGPVGPPSAPAKGMVKSRGAAPAGGSGAAAAADVAAPADAAPAAPPREPQETTAAADGPVVDLDFEPGDGPLVQEEVVQEEVVQKEVVDDFGGEEVTGMDRFES